MIDRFEKSVTDGSIDGEAARMWSYASAKSRPTLLADYDDFFAGAVEMATNLRAAHGFKSPDAIHLATAMHVGAKRFMTADLALRKCPGIEFEVVAVPPPPP